jgi:hypothetical protein
VRSATDMAIAVGLALAERALAASPGFAYAWYHSDGLRMFSDVCPS